MHVDDGLLLQLVGGPSHTPAMVAVCGGKEGGLPEVPAERLAGQLFPHDPPKFIVMEAQAADCLYQSALAGDGKPRNVTGDLSTIMAGLISTWLK